MFKFVFGVVVGVLGGIWLTGFGVLKTYERDGDLSHLEAVSAEALRRKRKAGAAKSDLNAEIESWLNSRR